MHDQPVSLLIALPIEGFESDSVLNQFSETLDRFSVQVESVSGSELRAHFDTPEHSLAFSRDTSNIAWRSAGRPPLDDGGWEKWYEWQPKLPTDARYEVGAPLLPVQFSQAGKGVHRYEMAWIVDPKAQANDRLVNELQLAPLGPGKLVWTAVKALWKLDRGVPAWKVVGGLLPQLAVEYGGKAAWKLIKKTDWYEHQRIHIGQFEAERRLALEMAALRAERLRSKSAAQRAKWQEHYRISDKMSDLMAQL